MIVVKVELWSALTNTTHELARMAIINDGTGSDDVANYNAATFKGRGQKSLDDAMLAGRITRTGSAGGHRRKALHVWHLVAKALGKLGYGAGA